MAKNDLKDEIKRLQKAALININEEDEEVSSDVVMDLYYTMDVAVRDLKKIMLLIEDLETDNDLLKNKTKIKSAWLAWMADYGQEIGKLLK
jgi:hypothetical protein